MLHLREDDRQEIIRLANEVFSAQIEIWAYGSRVDGSSHDASDLDLVLRGPSLQPIDPKELQLFREKLTASNIPILVQFFDWARIPESFRTNILKSYAPLV